MSEIKCELHGKKISLSRLRKMLKKIRSKFNHVIWDTY